MADHLANALAHIDIAGPDLPELARFYETVLDWRVSPRGSGYALVETPGPGPDGAITEAESASIVVGIVVADLAETLARAARSGLTDRTGESPNRQLPSRADPEGGHESARWPDGRGPLMGRLLSTSAWLLWWLRRIGGLTDKSPGHGGETWALA